MKKLLLSFGLSLILASSFLVTKSTPTSAFSDCNAFTAPGSPQPNKEFTISMGNVYGKDPTHYSYVIHFDNDVFAQDLTVSGSKSKNRADLTISGDILTVDVTGGFTNPGGFHYVVLETYKSSSVTSKTATVCEGTIFVADANGSCTADTTSGVVIDDKCAAGYVATPTGTDCGKGAQNFCYTGCHCLSGGSPSTTNGKGFGSFSYCNGKEGVQTPLGCIGSNPTQLVDSIFKIVLGFAGGLAILFIIIGGFKVATSQGDPDALEDGKSTITHAIIGLLFILLATIILGIIGVDILGIPYLRLK